jgi:hypothetical protein
MRSSVTASLMGSTRTTVPATWFSGSARRVMRAVNPARKPAERAWSKRTLIQTLRGSSSLRTA